MDIMQQLACLVINTITIYSYDFLFNSTALVGWWGGRSGLILNDNPDVKLLSVGWCLMLVLAWLTVAQLEIFFSSEYLCVMSPFLCFIIRC